MSEGFKLEQRMLLVQSTDCTTIPVGETPVLRLSNHPFPLAEVVNAVNFLRSGCPQVQVATQPIQFRSPNPDEATLGLEFFGLTECFFGYLKNLQLAGEKFHTSMKKLELSKDSIQSHFFGLITVTRSLE